MNNVDIAKEYVFGDDLLSQNTAAIVDDSVDGAVEGADSGETQTDTVFYHYDSLGTTRNLSNDSGVITDDYFYEAFGDLLASTGTTDNDYLYTGEQYDAALDNYYLRARYYNQGVGRFTQQDTYQGRLPEPETLHKYMYAHADPINNIDPSGNVTIAQLIRTLEIADRIATLSQAGFQPISLAGNAKGKPTVGQLGASRLLAFMPGASGIKFLRFTSKNKKVNGNSKNSRKRQHVYRIFDQSKFTVYKFGVSGGAINKNGTSRRAVAQLPRARKNLGTQKVSTKILYRNLSNRFIALEVEKALVCSFFRANNNNYPSGNIRPRPQCI